jgi:hypothetical protein
MSIFEDKKHNNGKYIGQKPVMVPQVPEDTKDRTLYIVNNEVFRDNSVRHVPDPVAGVFPGNPGPEPQRLRQAKEFLGTLMGGNYNAIMERKFVQEDYDKAREATGMARKRK